MIHSRSFVDVQIPPHGKLLGVFRVEVVGKEPHDYVRIYTIRAKDENAAAFEGINKFNEEIAALLQTGSE